MEIDMHSPSFRNRRSTSAKRPRSPSDSPGPAERYQKRLTLCTDRNTPPLQPVFQNQPDFQSAASFGGVADEGNGSAQDWVKQTGVLSIDSPLLATVAFGGDSRRQDDVMTVDAEEQFPSTNVQSIALQPQAPYTPAHHSRHATPSHLSTSFPPQPPHALQSSLLAPTPYPTINVLPATPADSPVAQRSASQHALAESPTMTTPRKGAPRFTMGPRSDCEKCRAGLRGHWAHVD